MMLSSLRQLHTPLNIFASFSADAISLPTDFIFAAFRRRFQIRRHQPPSQPFRH
jgi:hypothetical protein